jgi:hypothetical protein
MPKGYRLFYVTTWETMPGKREEVAAWYEQARDLWSRLPGVRSIEAFVPQFALGPSAQSVEVWAEIDDYGVMDRWDEAAATMGAEFLALGEQSAVCVQQGPSRLVGDWMGSRVQDLMES